MNLHTTWLNNSKKNNEFVPIELKTVLKRSILQYTYTSKEHLLFVPVQKLFQFVCTFYPYITLNNGLIKTVQTFR